MKPASFALIMAGGRGTRFWPASRARYPKQLLKILSAKSLIRETAERVIPLIGRDRTFVVTVREHAPAVRRELAVIPKANCLEEPWGRNTAPCIGLAALELARMDSNAAMIVLPADHWITDVQSFRRLLKTGVRIVAERDVAVTIGIRPSYPETGYGYIVKGKSLAGPNGPAWAVSGFKEKPPFDEAARLLRSGALWNSGIFIWKVRTILELLRDYSLPIYERLEAIRSAMGKQSLRAAKRPLRAAVARHYKDMPSLSVDYAVMEKAAAAGRVVTLAGNFGWSDVGSWAALHRLLARDRSNNAGVGQWLPLDSSDCLIYSPRRLAVVFGLSEAVVIDTPDALFVGNLKKSQDLRAVVAELEKRGYKHLT
ncbi:MAG TPA: sugar phosphate nucleotidyltransferase [Candidatus Acidoferrales bacterium]|nr:sugar phosphate nucleotidyltransferase [Candidatus Acidoferrales bacterium]